MGLSKTETKVKASTYGSIVAGAAIAILNAAAGDSALLGSVPPWVQAVLLALVPGALAWLGGFVTPSKTSTVSTGYRERP